MTYGENGAAIRAALSELLSQHRIQQRLGGAGVHTMRVTTTPAEREELGGLIRRYRQTVLAWCHHASVAADIHTGSDPFVTLDKRPQRSAGPVGQLRHALNRSLERSTAGLPTIEELTTHQPYRLVETWRQVARATAIGEDDFDPWIEHAVGGGLLPARQAMTLAQDVAAITQALVILDARYRAIPGWERLSQCSRLGWAALATALEAGADQADYAIDERGWRPPARLIGGTPRPGILGVLQAEHNLLIRLNPYPRSTNLKLVVDSQRILSAELATRIGRIGGLGDLGGTARGLREHWMARARTYDLIHRELRNFAGHTGHGAQAAAEAANTLSRLRRIPRDSEIDPRVLTGFQKLFNRIDTRIADIIDHGLAQKALYLRVRVPRIVDNTGDVVHPIRERYVPVTSPVQTDLPEIVSERLRPPPATPVVPPGAVRNRSDLHTALLHQPSGSDGGMAAI